MFSSEQYRALREGAALVDRSDRGRLRLSGADRRDYLQGLLTNDILALTAGSGCYACHLTAQQRDHAWTTEVLPTLGEQGES